MPFAPGVTDISGQLLGAGISSAGDSIAKAIQQFHQNKQQNDFFTQQGADLAGMTGPDGRPLMTASQLKALSSGNLGQKKAAVADALFNINQSHVAASTAYSNEATRALRIQNDVTQSGIEAGARNRAALDSWDAGQPQSPAAQPQQRQVNTGSPAFQPQFTPQELAAFGQNFQPSPTPTLQELNRYNFQQQPSADAVPFGLFNQGGR